MLYRMTIGLSILLLSAGCGADDDNDGGKGGNGGNGGDECSVNVELSGAVTESISWGDAEGCGSATSGSSATLTFGALSDTPSVTVGLSGVTAGETGEVDTYVGYRTADGDEWITNDCTVELTRNELVEEDDIGETYALEGAGSCSSPATPRGGDADGEVEVSDFDFAATAFF